MLQGGDVPREFERFDFGRMSPNDLPAGERADPTRFGREAGWKARYRRTGTADTAGPLVIESLLDVFDDSGGAEDELAAIRREVTTPTAPVVTPLAPLPDPQLGDEAVAWSSRLPSQPRDTVFYTVAWRHENAVAAVTVNGFDGLLGPEAALELAAKQQARLQAG